MHESFPFHVYSGLLTKEHRKRIGSALWEFLWCIDRTTKEVEEDGEMIGLVLGGKPINLSDIADELGGNRSTTHRNLEKLEREGYIHIIRAPYGLILKVKNSKKWLVAKTQQEPKKSKFPLQKRNDRCKNANSNKDKAVDKAFITTTDKELLQKRNDNSQGMPSPQNAGSVELDADSNQLTVSTQQYVSQISAKYIRRRGKGFDLSAKDELAVNELIENQIPLRAALEGIDKAFDDFEKKRKHKHQRIHSLSYCVPIIFDLYHSSGGEKVETDLRGPRSSVRANQRASGEYESQSYYAGIGKKL